jgi:hypothetical protein
VVGGEILDRVDITMEVDTIIGVMMAITMDMADHLAVGM